jgi:hypothetical protein
MDATDTPLIFIALKVILSKKSRTRLLPDCFFPKKKINGKA